MKYVFLLNSFTINNVLDVKKRIELYGNKNKLNYVIEINNDDYSTEEILAKYKNRKNIIVAIGGDGLINRVVNNIVNTKNILCIIPYGTGNDFYKSVKEQFQEEYNKCDVVKINDRYFINTACFGIDADVANNKNLIKSKWIPRSSKYILGLIYSYFNYKCRPFEVLVNNEKIEDIFTTIAVCNGKYYGGGFIIGPTSKLNDGMLNIYLVKKLNKINMLNLILKLKNGKHEKSKQVRKIMTKKINIVSKNIIKCNIDGEVLEDKKFDIEIINNGITLYYNKELIESILK